MQYNFLFTYHKNITVINYDSYSSVAIDNLYFQFYKHPNIGIACLYADYKDQTNQTVVHILGSFLRQLLTTVPQPISDDVIQKLDDIRLGGRKVEIEDTLALLKIRLHQLKLKRAFICIDAVDELEPKVRQQLLNVLKKLVNNNVRLFLTGRDHVENEIQKRFKVEQGYTVNITASQKDIQEFVRQQINEDLNPEAMDTGLAKGTEDTIMEKSKGM